MMAIKPSDTLTANIFNLFFGGHSLNTLCKCLFTLISLLVTCPVKGQVYHYERPHVQFISVSYGDGKLYFNFRKGLLERPLMMTKNSTEYHQVMFVSYGSVISLESRPIVSQSGIVIPIGNELELERRVFGEFSILSNPQQDGNISIDVTSLFPNSSKGSVEVRYFKNETMLSFTDGIAKDYYSFYLLPEPMRSRSFDYRMGFFIEDTYSPLNHFPYKAKGNIMRWRLEKLKEGDAISPPKQPLVFYLHSNIPDKYRPYVKAGILEWQTAFEAAGFSETLVVEDPPLEDEDWKLHSLQNTFVTWKDKSGIRGSSLSANGNALKVVDFRSGEILKSTVKITAGYQSWLDDYLVRCGPLDNRVLQQSPTDDLTGAIVQALVAHEMGHAFGLQDGNYGEYTYPVDSVRKISWLATMGHTPSVMNYTRAHHIAQPEDSIPPHLLLQKVGPTDRYSIEWGYRQLKTKEEEDVFLEAMIRMQDSMPWYRFIQGNYERKGPQYGNEVADNKDPIQSAVLGVENLKRVMRLIPKVTQIDDDYGRQERLLKRSLQLWRDQMMNVTSLIGGYEVQHKSLGQGGSVYTPIPMEIQAEALEYLLSEVFKRPEWLATPPFTYQFEYSIVSDGIVQHQLQVMKELLGPLKLKRLEKMETLFDGSDLLYNTIEALQNGLWDELEDRSITITSNRQELQLAYISFLINALSKPKDYGTTLPTAKYDEYTDYSKSILMGQLWHLHKNIEKHLKKTVKDSSTLGHLFLCKQTLEQFL